MEYTQQFAERLTQLRTEKGVSARDMSLSLGQSESYINKIENRRTLPSMTGFFYICEYLGVEPKDFFDFAVESPTKSAEVAQKINTLSPTQAEHILLLIDDLTK